MTEFTLPDFAFSDRQPLTATGNTAITFPDDTLVVAIGDVHGQAVGFRRALDQAARFAPTGKRRHLVLTGDLIDRGPDSFGCLDIAASAQSEYGFDGFTYLPGNHELLMLDALDEMDTHGDALYVASLWMRNGGWKMACELFDEQDLKGDVDWRAVGAAITAALPAINGRPYREALRAAPSHARFGGVVFLHAGVDPDEPLGVALGRAQSLHLETTRSPLGFIHHDCHWAWARYNFLCHDGGWRDGQDTPLLMVHGHTMADGADTGWLWDANGALLSGLDRSTTHGRICIDGAAARGALVAGVAFTHEGYRVFAAPCG